MQLAFGVTVYVPKVMNPSRTSFLSLVLLGLPLAMGAAQPPQAEPGVVELPKFEVVDSRILPPPEKWHYASIPGFEVLSSVSERESKRFVRDFLLLQEALGELMPGLAQTNVVVPTSLILCGRGNGFNRFMPDDRGDDLYATNSLFFDDPERGAIIVDFALSDLRLDNDTTLEADPYRSFYKEYFRHLIRVQMGGKPPPWFEEGLVQMFSAIDFNKKWVTFAQIGDGFGGGKDSDFNQILAQHGIMPLADMFARDSVMTDTYWSAQCYAFVHMCLYGRNQKYQKPFLIFLTKLGKDGPSEELFKECFKKSYKDMALELRGYLGFTDHKYIVLEAKKGHSLPEPPQVELRDATESEAGRIVGGALRLGGHGDQAHLALIAPYIRGERDPQLLGALGLDERLAGDDARAKKFLEAAVEKKVARPRVYLELARLRHAAVAAAVEQKENKAFSEAQVANILEPLKAARTMPPPMGEIYELVAEVWMHSARPPTADDLKFVNEGVMTFPRRPVLLVRAADLNLRFGKPEDARNIINFGLKVVPNSPARLALVSLQEALPPMPEPPVAPAPTAPATPAGQGASGQKVGGYAVMIRKAIVMSVHPGHEAEYERRHGPIWPELEAVLKAHGVHNYSIFLHAETRQLFAYAEIEDEARWAAIARTEVCQRWWKHMGDVMPSNVDHSPVARDLREVFHLT